MAPEMLAFLVPAIYNPLLAPCRAPAPWAGIDGVTLVVMQQERNEGLWEELGYSSVRKGCAIR